MKKLCENKVTGNIIIVIASIIILYLLFSVYFNKHFFFYTVINGANMSLKSYANEDEAIGKFVADYKLELIGIDGAREEITGQDIGFQYNVTNSIHKVRHMQKSFQWISSVYKKPKYYVNDLYKFKEDSLNHTLDGLKCINNTPVKSQNVSFLYKDASYEVVKEKYGNIINRDQLRKAVIASILQGKKVLNLFDENCYEMPRFTLNSDKTAKTKNLLDQYVLTKITYQFGNSKEILDGNIINQWLYVDDNLEVQIDKNAVIQYVKDLSSIYDTVGIIRNFKTSTGKVIEIKKGLYGWKINQDAEVKALLNNIKLGAEIEKEPVYSQKALSRNENEIGNTYVEINITRQMLWFYKAGKLIAHGSVVTGNPNRGNATVQGVYGLMYKEKDTSLKGPGYEVGVTYWMPFYGNIGIHDASWRNSFGGDIYKRNGTHGCVNAPYYLAKTIYDNIKEGIPVIVYVEENEKKEQP